MSKLPREPSEVTPEGTYVRRRELIRNAAAFLGTAAIGGGALTALVRGRVVPKKVAEAPLPEPVPGEFMPDGLDIKKNAAFDLPDKTPLESITHYNNYYELGYSKSEPSENASELVIRPWTVAFEGEIANPQTIDIDTLIRWFPLEERVYRMRCVETWSMVIPWMGFPLAELIKRLEPTSRAKYVAFETLYRPGQMPGQKRDVLDWPYVEGLRIDEAMNPLTLMAVGLYGRALPRQNGAPMRLVVPWKYGFKGIKAIVKMRFLEREPKTTWNISAPSEYGFYANVNPAVDHPRWSQASERRVGETDRRPTLPFNGYAEQVASLYDGMDLKRKF